MNREEIFETIKNSKDFLDKKWDIMKNFYSKEDWKRVFVFKLSPIGGTSFYEFSFNTMSDCIICRNENWDQFLEEIKTKWVDVDGD